MLTAVLLAAALVASGGAATQPQTSAIFAIEVRGTTPRAAPELWLLRLDQRTLVRTAEVFLAAEDWSFSSLAPSPGRGRLAVATGRNVRFVDAESMRVLGTAALAGKVLQVSWPYARTLIGVSRGGFFRVNVNDEQSVTEWPVGDWFLDAYATPRQVVAVTGPRYVADRGLMGGQPIRVGRLTPSGVPRWTRLDRVRIAIETWHVKRGAVLPPLAREGVEQAQADLEARHGISPSESRPVSVIPFVKSGLGGFVYQGHYEIVLEGRRGEYYLYTAYLGEVGGITAYLRSRLPGPPPVSESDILHVPVGTWEVSTVSLTIGPKGIRAYVVTPGAVFAEVDLPQMRPRYRALRRALGGFPIHPRAGTVVEAPSSAFVSGSTIAVATHPVKLIDVPTARVRALSTYWHARVSPTGTGFIVASPYTAHHSQTLRVYDRRGHLRYTRQFDELVDRVQAEGRYAYVSLRYLTGRRALAVIDIEQRGRELHRVERPFVGELLVGRR